MAVSQECVSAYSGFVLKRSNLQAGIIQTEQKVKQEACQNKTHEYIITRQMTEQKKQLSNNDLPQLETKKCNITTKATMKTKLNSTTDITTNTK